MDSFYKIIWLIFSIVYFSLVGSAFAESMQQPFDTRFKIYSHQTQSQSKNKEFVYKLDSFTGKLFTLLENHWIEILVKDLPVIYSPNKSRFILFNSFQNSNGLYLIDSTTGQTWKSSGATFIRYAKEGNKFRVTYLDTWIPIVEVKPEEPFTVNKITENLLK